MMFWTDWNRDAPKIETAYMDGTHRKVLVADNLGLPNGLIINYEDHTVCWADAGMVLSYTPIFTGYNQMSAPWSDWPPHGA